MTYLKSWEEFEKAGERLYLQNPLKARYTMKYIHKDGHLYLKLTDDVEVSKNRNFVVNVRMVQRTISSTKESPKQLLCLQYKTEIVQDLKKIEKFVGNLMKHMASKEV